MDRTDSPTLSFATLPLFKRRKTLSKSRTSLTADPKVRFTPPQAAAALLPARTPVLSRLHASIQNLPTEIVLNIIAYAVPSIYERTLNFRADPLRFYNELTPDFRKVLVDTQRSLRNAALISRAWYPAVNELLYSCPFLGSSRSVLAFSRSLRACRELGPLVHDVWVFNEDLPKHSDLIGIKRKSTKRVQADFTVTLRELTSLDSVIICNHGIIDRHEFPIDNILVYSLPADTRDSWVPKLSLYGPSPFNAPWAKHPKANNFLPSRLEHLCMRDIEITPAELKCAPCLPTLPRLHTLQIAMFNHNETPFISSATVPMMRTFELYRDMFDSRHANDTRTVGVDPTCIRNLERLFFIGRAVESAVFAYWAGQLLFTQLKHLAIGLLHIDQHKLIAEWRLPDHLETLEVVVWHNEKPMKLHLGEMGHADGVLRALHSCLHLNRQSRAFKKLVVRATGELPRNIFTPLLDSLDELCEKHGFIFELHEGGVEKWIAARLEGSDV